MKSCLLLFSLLVVSNVAFAKDEVYITVGADTVSKVNKSLKSSKILNGNSEVTILKVKRNSLATLSHLMHESFHRCGGFIAHDSLDEALEVVNNLSFNNKNAKLAFSNYSITKDNVVNNMISQVNEFNIRTTIEKMSAFHNRYYKAQTGVDSQAWVKALWESYASGRSDVKVEYFNHRSWPQPSVIMTVEGRSKKDEIVVIGGHADSIAGLFFRKRARAPGADDNASGIASISEIINVLMQNNFKPERTIKFMAYAAEEVGLLGSKEIAKSFKSNNQNVVGVLQLDMTNFKGTTDKDIVFMTDFTNEQQNKFLGALIDHYLQLNWGYSQCGYACSDHASWHTAGYPASIPFESNQNDMNNKIHTNKDVIENSNGDAVHAQKFTKLGIAFAVEMTK